LQRNPAATLLVIAKERRLILRSKSLVNIPAVGASAKGEASSAAGCCGTSCFAIADWLAAIAPSDPRR